jgi:hypothetical protein
VCGSVIEEHITGWVDAGKEVQVKDVGVAAMTAYDTAFLLWTNDYCIEFSFFSFLLSTFH